MPALPNPCMVCEGCNLAAQVQSLQVLHYWSLVAISSPGIVTIQIYCSCQLRQLCLAFYVDMFCVGLAWRRIGRRASNGPLIPPGHLLCHPCFKILNGDTRVRKRAVILVKQSLCISVHVKARFAEAYAADWKSITEIRTTSNICIHATFIS